MKGTWSLKSAHAVDTVLLKIPSYAAPACISRTLKATLLDITSNTNNSNNSNNNNITDSTGRLKMVQSPILRVQVHRLLFG